MLPLFEVECEDPKKGVQLLKVYDVVFDNVTMAQIWERQKQFRTMMGREIHTFEELTNFFIETKPDGSFQSRGICYRIASDEDPMVGIFWLSDIHYPAYAEVHYTFFDRRHKGRVQLIREALKYARKTFDIKRYYVRVGLYAKLPIKFVEEIGFFKEGRLRHCMYYRGDFWDANQYSLLKEEIDKWEEEVNHMTTKQKLNTP